MQHFYSFVSQVCHCQCPPFSAGHVAFLFICLPGLSLLVSASFCWSCSISIRLSPSLHCWCPPFSVNHISFLFISQVCHWWCPPLDAGHVAFLYSFVSQVCHWRCPPLSVGHAAFLFICLPGLSLLVSALFRWRCNISVRLSPRSVTGGVRPFPLFLFICLPCLSLLISAPRSISIHLFPRLVTGGVRPFPLFLFICLPGLSLLVSALFRWPSGLSLVLPFCAVSIHLSPISVTANSAGHAAFLLICPPGLSLVVPALLRCFYSFVSQVCHCWCLPVSALFRWPCSISIHLPGLSLLACSISIHVSPRPVTGGVRPLPLAM